MSMMGKQLALMGDVEMAFTSIRGLFSAIDNTVKVTMRSALEDLKQKVEMRLKNGRPTKEFVLNEHAKHVGGFREGKCGADGVF
jgi:aspartyl/asparaginyl-tRNA synthetase